MPSNLTIIVAATAKNGIGKNGKLPWHISKDLAFFSRATTSAPQGSMNALFMGRATWESIPPAFRPLKKRINAVLSRDEDYDLGKPRQDTPTHVYQGLQTAVDNVTSLYNVHRLFITGGSSLYNETLGPSTPLQADRILLTRIYAPDFDCDTFFPDLLGNDNGIAWRRASHEELCAWVGENLDVPVGIQVENGVEFEFQMWLRSKGDSTATNGCR
ncbi:dihydrofolate reductase-like domain-containing protein [Phlebopus sp. FC_14]|nr:dihydrofolate reductase-like domain-containing protein [Phlebopus sp. FC_14]